MTGEALLVLAVTLAVFTTGGVVGACWEAARPGGIVAAVERLRAVEAELEATRTQLRHAEAIRSTYGAAVTHMSHRRTGR